MNGMRKIMVEEKFTMRKYLLSNFLRRFLLNLLTFKRSVKKFNLRMENHSIYTDFEI